MPFMPEFLFSSMFFIQYKASAVCSYQEPFFSSMFGFCKIIAMKIFLNLSRESRKFEYSYVQRICTGLMK